MTADRYPNLFIAGVPKAATTTWYTVLDRHPDVYMPDKKEPRFLNTDFTFDFRVETEEEYLSLYEDAGDEHRRGEASPWYVYSEEATRKIRERVDDPRIVVLLRDPVERIYSQHGQFVMTGAENIESFREALAASQARKRGERLPRRVEPREALYYWDVAHYAPHVRRYLDTFEDHELMFIRFEDFTDDPRAVYREICEFIGVDPSIDVEIPNSNAHQEIRSRRFRELVRDPPEPVQTVTALFPLAWRDRLREIFKGVNRKETDRDPLPDDLRRELTEHCRRDVEEVEDLLGWDLTDWKHVDAPEPTTEGTGVGDEVRAVDETPT
jgi:hypothetical protein